MLHSILITGGSHQARFKAAQKQTRTDLNPEPDTLVLEADPSIGIADIRALEKFLAKKPYQKDQKIAFLPQADKLTLPAQNALLKTLEEPPANSLIILLSPHDHLLLPTIVSRCQPIRLTSSIKLTASQLETQQQIFQTICQASLGQRVNLTAAYTKSKDEAIKFCQKQLMFLRQQMLQKPTASPIKLIRQLNQTLSRLEANVNPKLCLEWLFFSYPKV